MYNNTGLCYWEGEHPDFHTKNLLRQKPRPLKSLVVDIFAGLLSWTPFNVDIPAPATCINPTWHINNSKSTRFRGKYSNAPMKSNEHVSKLGTTVG